MARSNFHQLWDAADRIILRQVLTGNKKVPRTETHNNIGALEKLTGAV